MDSIRQYANKVTASLEFDRGDRRYKKIGEDMESVWVRSLLTNKIRKFNLNEFRLWNQR